jgi:tetratricopeptide (TPR) repeat protein
MGLADPSSFEQVFDFLLQRTFINSRDELFGRISNPPTLLTKALDAGRAYRLRETLEQLGAIVELQERRMKDRGSAKKMVKEGEQLPQEQAASGSKRSGRGYVVLFLFSVAAVLYMVYQHGINGEGDSVSMTVQKIASRFPEPISKNTDDTHAAAREESASLSGSADPKGVGLNNEGVALMDEERFAEAVQVFEKALALIPGDGTILKNLHRAWLHLGYQELDNQNFEKSILALEQAVKILDDSPDAYKAMGMAALELGDEEGAELFFKSYLDRVSDDPAVARILGEMLYKQNRLEDGIRYLRAYLQANPGDVRVQNLLAKAGREAVVEEDFDAQVGRHFDVRYDGLENMDSGYLVVGLLEDAYQRIGAQLNYYPTERLTTILYSDEDFRIVTQTPDWARGIYDGKIRLPIGGLREKSEMLERVVAHEYTHALVHQMTGGRIPTWLNEGLAQYFEGEPNQGHGRNAGYIHSTQDFISLRNLENSFLRMDANTASIAYTQSYTVVEQIVEEHGIYAVQKLLAELAGGADVEASLIAAVGLDYAGLQEEWLSYLARNYQQ